jgi:Holliday junction resolvasome RuvABC endonuclease subunit
MTPRVLSLDIATITGWGFMSIPKVEEFKLGIIKTNSEFSEAQRLAYFRNELVGLLSEFKPTHVVMEDIYSGVNVNVMKLLSKFAGVAEECCLSIAGIEPYIIHTNTVKSYFKVKNKQQLFDFVVEVLGFENDDVSFKKHNDIIDAVGQLLCYCDTVLGIKNFRLEKNYGFLYEV